MAEENGTAGRNSGDTGNGGKAGAGRPRARAYATWAASSPLTLIAAAHGQDIAKLFSGLEHADARAGVDEVGRSRLFPGARSARHDGR